MQTNQIELSDLYTVQQLAARYPHILSVLTLRYQLRNRDANGLAKACVRIGKKLLISHSRYQAWLAETAEQ
ncbi:hypothetical protein [Ralstonia pseudosolanacearum]|uniref:hypothetical protein n=1 Tax=Ralstonia pseudosolanacearum TaxID=1310165 RepID=UPI002674B548|nr:hypothetical protein [Ralstonia pseudosolanacearum]MDO3553085.1 hypothetical protein [Ralstonia pseudosolanacearum]MDO3582227.1 hypothetical protein [Ralstonia pseudosolanacearum]